MANAHYSSNDDTGARSDIKHTTMPNAMGAEITTGDNYRATNMATTTTNANAHNTSPSTITARATNAIDGTAIDTRHVHTACTMTAPNINAIVNNDLYNIMPAYNTNNEAHATMMHSTGIHCVQRLRTTICV